MCQQSAWTNHDDSSALGDGMDGHWARENNLRVDAVCFCAYLGCVVELWIVSKMFYLVQFVEDGKLKVAVEDDFSGPVNTCTWNVRKAYYVRWDDHDVYYKATILEFNESKEKIEDKLRSLQFSVKRQRKVNPKLLDSASSAGDDNEVMEKQRKKTLVQNKKISKRIVEEKIFLDSAKIEMTEKVAVDIKSGKNKVIKTNNGKVGESQKSRDDLGGDRAPKKITDARSGDVKKVAGKQEAHQTNNNIKANIADKKKEFAIGKNIFKKGSGMGSNESSNAKTNSADMKRMSVPNTNNKELLSKITEAKNVVKKVSAVRSSDKGADANIAKSNTVGVRKVSTTFNGNNKPDVHVIKGVDQSTKAMQMKIIKLEGEVDALKLMNEKLTDIVIAKLDVLIELVNKKPVGEEFEPAAQRHPDMMHLGQDVFIRTEEYHRIKVLANTAQQFIKNLAEAVFGGDDELSKYSVSGRGGNYHKSDPRPQLNSTKLSVILATFKKYLIQRGESQETIDRELKMSKTYIARKISEARRKLGLSNKENGKDRDVKEQEENLELKDSESQEVEEAEDAKINSEVEENGYYSGLEEEEEDIEEEEEKEEIQEEEEEEEGIQKGEEDQEVEEKEDRMAEEEDRKSEEDTDGMVEDVEEDQAPGGTP